MEAHMNQWRKTLTPIPAAVLWSRSQSCSGGLDLRKYTAPNGNTGSGQGFSCASTQNVSTNAADKMPAQANLIFVMIAKTFPDRPPGLRPGDVALVPRPFDLFLNASGRACPAPTPALVGARHASPPRRMLPRGQERNHPAPPLARPK